MAFDIWCSNGYVDKNKQYDLQQSGEDTDDNSLVHDIVTKILEDPIESSTMEVSMAVPGDVPSSITSSPPTLPYTYKSPLIPSSSYFSDASHNVTAFNINNHFDNTTMSSSSGGHSPFSTSYSPPNTNHNSIFGEQLNGLLESCKSFVDNNVGVISQNNSFTFDFLDEDERKPMFYQPLNNVIDDKDSKSLEFHDNGTVSDYNENDACIYNMDLLRLATAEVGKIQSEDDKKISDASDLDKLVIIPYLDLTEGFSPFLPVTNNNYIPQSMSQKMPVNFNNSSLNMLSNKHMEPIVKTPIDGNSSNGSMFVLDPRILSQPPPNMMPNNDYGFNQQPNPMENYGYFPNYKSVDPSQNVQKFQLPNSFNSANMNGFNQVFPNVQNICPTMPVINRPYVNNDTSSYSLLSREQSNGHFGGQVQRPVFPRMQNIVNEYADARNGPANGVIVSTSVPPPSIPASVTIPGIMADLFSHVSHRTMRGDDPANVLQMYLENCYEQWRLLEVERKKTEAELAMTFPGRMMSTPTNISLPRSAPLNNTRLDRLLVDMLREHSKVMTLMCKMEQLRELSKKKLEEVSPSSAVTLLKRGEALDATESLVNKIGVGTFPDIEQEVATWKAAIDEVKASREKELFWYKKTDMPAIMSRLSVVKNPTPDEKKTIDLFNHQSNYIMSMMALSVKKLSQTAKKARLAMWCNLTLTKAMAKEEEPKPPKKTQFVFSALVKFKEICESQKDKNESTTHNENAKDVKPCEDKISKDQKIPAKTLEKSSSNTDASKDKKCAQQPKTTQQKSASSSNVPTSAASGNGKNQSSSKQNYTNSSNMSAMGNHQRMSPKRGNPLMFPYGNAFFYPRGGMQYFPYDRSRFMQPFNMNYRFGQRVNNSRGKDYQSKSNHNNNYLSAAPIK